MAVPGGITPTKDWQNALKFDDLARSAVFGYNIEQNTQLEFKKVTDVKEQLVSGIIYYITLEVADGGQKKTYVAKVFVKPGEVEEFKLVNDA
ncbi:hypothetical protein ACS0TY_005253 [Phlomoides rotata]